MDVSYVKINDVTKKLQGQVVLNKIDLHLEKGNIYGIQGKNGSGKTMLLRLICGLIVPTEGSVEVAGKKLDSKNSFPESVGILIEYPGFLPQYTGFKNLQLLAAIRKKIDDRRIREVLEIVGLDPNDRRKYRKYSLGMRQRLGIAQAIMEDPDLLLLDEPTNALDADAVENMRSLLLRMKQEGKTIVIASHDREELEKLSDEKIIIERGTIVGRQRSEEFKKAGVTL
ncbi:ATP-binding cassette domain-containing protein [Paenibacillus chitinolyticus]|uniref:ATP-binding cassette domain-containing protein n=1 Tax=Paenibacillus chitinolyticus TaxID=79263 RepID=UPI003656EB37